MIKNRCFDTGDNFSNTAFAKQENANVNDNMNFAMPGVCQPPIYECPKKGVVIEKFTMKLNILFP